MTWCAARNAAAEHKTISNMISFGVMTVLLAVLACMVHYDLFGLFPAYPYGRHARDERRQQEQYKQQRPGYEEPGDDKGQHVYESVVRSTFDDAWLPRPGTDPHTLFQRPTIVVHDYGDYRPADGRNDYWMDDDYWTDGEEDVQTAVDNDDDDDDESWSKVTSDDGDEDDGDGRVVGDGGAGDGAAWAGDRAAGAGADNTCRAPVAATSEGCKAESTVVGVAQPPPDRSSSRPFDDDPDDGYEYDEDYMAPGEERDDDVF